ncbi:hypothetical protein [Bacteroides timonensis]|uniref:hypothetical protein n=1 Tax=Bacteroides timonensis TaxID=1470345 RepID=UPI0004B74C1E|nr:hypothetical protein [Bacteroides timonensis]
MRTFFFIALCCLSSLCYAAIPTDSTETKKIENPDGYTYIVDNKIVSRQYVIDHLEDIEAVARYESVRDAILRSGGKYRVPTVVCRTRKAEDK